MKFPILPVLWTLAHNGSVLVKVRNASRRCTLAKWKASQPRERCQPLRMPRVRGWGAGGRCLAPPKSSSHTSLCAISHFLLMETILPSKKKTTFSPHLMMWTSAKLNVLRGGQPTSIKEKSQTPVFCWSVLPWKQTPGDGKCGKSFNVPAKRKNTFSFLYVGQPHLARQRPAEWKVICAKPSWAVSWAQQAVTWTQTNRNLEKEPAA